MIEVLPENLEVRKKYYIECLTYDENNNITIYIPSYRSTGIYMKYRLTESPFNHRIVYFKNFRRINCQNPLFEGNAVKLNKLWRFYEVQKDQIQNNMEKRAINMILQRIIGDKYFQYL